MYTLVFLRTNFEKMSERSGEWAEKRRNRDGVRGSREGRNVPGVGVQNEEWRDSHFLSHLSGLY